MGEEILKRFGGAWETAAELARKCIDAERALGIHGVSVTAREVRAPCSSVPRLLMEAHFLVHNTPSRRDRFHRTIELPNPVTDEVADLYNRLLGRRE